MYLGLTFLVTSQEEWLRLWGRYFVKEECITFILSLALQFALESPEKLLKRT